MSQEHRPLKSRSKGCARKSGLLNRTPYANHESPQFTQAYLDGIAATSALIFAVAGVTLLFICARPLPLGRSNVNAHIRRRWCTMFCRCRSFTRPAAENTAEVTADTTAMARKTADSTHADHRCIRVVWHPENSRKQCPWNSRMPITPAFACGETTKTVGNNAPRNRRMPITVAIACGDTTGGLRSGCCCGCSSSWSGWLHLRPVAPRGAYAPRSCAAMRMSAGEKTIFAMHKRTARMVAMFSCGRRQN
jgi:hypothetical protein